MRYFDTSFFVPLVLDEATSEQICEFVVDIPKGDPAISRLVRLEFSSTLARGVRMGSILPSAAANAEAYASTFVDQSFSVLLPATTDFDLAHSYIGDFRTGLRTNDALHLAIAHNNRCEAIYTLDKTLLRAGKMLGLPVSTGISLPGYDV